MSAPLPLFGAAWAERWRTEVDGSEAYRRAASGWEGALALRLSAPDGRAVWADLWHGRCRAARPATADDLSSAPFVLEAPLATWRRLLDGGLDPLWAVISGKVKLARGSVAALVPWALAARELVAAARRVPTDFAAGAASSPAAADASLAPAPALPPAATDRDLAPAVRTYQTTSARGLDRQSFPMRLFEKAKRRGIWNPADIDLQRDREDWRRLQPLERDVLLRLASLFQAGEESVTLDLLPLIQAVAAEGRIEEEIYLTSFLFEEAKHVDLFRRFFDEVAFGEQPADSIDLAGYHGPSFRRIVYEALPGALARLRHDASPVAQAEASVTYNLIVEGVLAETGYHAFSTMLRRQGLLPGLQQGVALLKSDESRHLAYGVWLLSRLVAEHGEPVWLAIERRMEALLPDALGVVEDAFAAYEVPPFGLDRAEMLRFAARQFEARLQRIAAARRGSLAELLHEALPEEPPEEPLDA